MTQTEVLHTVGQEVQTAQEVIGSIKPRRISANRIALPISDIFVVTDDMRGNLTNHVVDLKGLQALIQTPMIKIIAMYWNGLEQQKVEVAPKATV